MVDEGNKRFALKPILVVAYFSEKEKQHHSKHFLLCHHQALTGASHRVFTFHLVYSHCYVDVLLVFVVVVVVDDERYFYSLVTASSYQR